MGRTGHNYALLYLPTLSLIPSIYSLKYIDPAYIVSYTIKKHPSTSSTTTVVIWSPHLTDIVMFNSCCKVGNVSEWSTGDDGLLNVPDHAVWVSLGSFIIISTTINGNDQSTHCTSSSLWYVMEMNGEIVDKSYEKQVTNIPTKVQKITMTVNQQKHYRKYGKQALLALMIQNCIKQTKNVSEKNFRSFSANQNPLTKHQLALIISDDWFGVHAPSLITNTWKTLECLPINVSPNINLDLNVTDEIVSWQMSSRRIHNDLVSPEPANLNSLVDDVDYDFKLPNHDELEETMQQLNDQIKQNEKAKSSKHIKDMEIYVEKNSNKKKTRVKKNTVNDSDVEVLENHVTPRPKRNKVESKSEASSASSGNSAAVVSSN